MTAIYKVLTKAQWQDFESNGRFAGSPADLADGFIHFSYADQLAETLRKHFHGQAGLVLLAISSEDCGAALKAEPSRGGALFPHLYGVLSLAMVQAKTELALDAAGMPQMPAQLPDVGWNK